MAVIIDGDLGIDKIKDGVVTSDDLASTLDLSGKTITLATDAVDQLSTASGSAPSYSARAWVNFNGTGTVAIRESGNVSSITDNGTGDYTINFTTDMPDANYSINGICQRTIANTDLYVGLYYGGTMNQTLSSVRLQTRTGSGYSLEDATVVCASVFR